MSWDCPKCGYSNRNYLKRCVCGYEIEFEDNRLKVRKNGHSNGVKNLTTKVNGTTFPDSKPPPHVSWRSIFSFDGRISRSTYWAVLIPLFLLSFLLQIGVATSAYGIGFGGIAGLLLIIPAMWVALATYAKRWQDLNKSGWMSLTLFIPFVNLLIFLYLGLAPGTSGYNIYGADPRKGK